MAIRVTCTQCGAAYKIDETKIPATGGAVKCQACGTRFAVMPSGQPAATAAVPLPGATPPPTPPDASGPIPLPSAENSAQTTIGKPPTPIALPGAEKTVHDEVTSPGRKFSPIHDEVTKPAIVAAASSAIPLPSAPAGPHDAVTKTATPVVTPPSPAAIALPAAPPSPHDEVTKTNAIALPAAPPPVDRERTNPSIPLPAGFAEKTNPSIPLPVGPSPEPAKAIALPASPPAAIPLPPSESTGAIVLDETDDLFGESKTMVSAAPVVAPAPPVVIAPPPPVVIAPPAPVVIAPPPAVIAPPEPLDLPEPVEEAEAIEEVDEFIDDVSTSVGSAPQPQTVETQADATPEPALDVPNALADDAFNAPTAVGPAPTKINFDDLPAADDAEVATSTPEMPDDLPAPIAEPQDTPHFDGITLGQSVDDLPGPVSDGAVSDEPSQAQDTHDGQTFIGPPPDDNADSLDIPEPLDTGELLGTSKSAAPEDDLPTPLDLEDGEQAPKQEATQISAARDRQARASQQQTEVDDAEASGERKKRRARLGLMAAAMVVLVVGGGTLASYLMTGEMPWTLLNPPPPPPPKQPVVQLPPVPPAPDFAAIEGKDLDAYTKALAVLEERAKARKARGEPDNKDDAAMRMRLLWQGAILLGSHALADQLLAAPPTEGPDLHPHEERANAARAYLKGDTAAMQAQLDKLFARDKGDRDSHLLAGYAALGKGDTAAAGKHFEEVIRVDDVNKTGPRSIDAFLGQAEIARRSGDRDSVASYVDKAEEAQPQTFRVIIARAELNEADPEKRADAKKSITEVMKFLDNLGERDRARARALFATFAAEAARSNIALAELQKAWDEDPSATLGRNLVWTLIAKGDDEGAKKALDKARKLDDGSYAESFFLASVLLMAKGGDVAGLAPAIAAAKAANIDKRSLSFAEGVSLEAQKKNPAAMKAYAASLKADKTFALPMLAMIRLAPQKPKVKLPRLALAAKVTGDARAYVAQADMLFDVGNFPEAVDKYLQGLKNDPWVVDLGRVSTRYADALSKSGKTAEAALVAIENTIVDPKDTDALLKVIQTARDAGAFDEAQRLINSGLDLNPKETRLRLAEADVMIAKDAGDKARSILQQVLKADEKSVRALELMARSYYPKDPDLVKLHIKKAIELKPDEAKFHYLLGQAYIEKGKFEEARDAFERSLELNDKNADAHIMLAKVTDQLGRKKESADELKKALAIDPERKAVVLELGQKLEDLNQMADALDLYTAQFKKEPGNGALAVRIGRIHQQNGNRPNAIKFFRIALKINPGDASAHYRLGYLFKDAGQNKEALKSFQMYLKLAPNAPDKTEIEEEISDLKN